MISEKLMTSVADLRQLTAELVYHGIGLQICEWEQILIDTDAIVDDALDHRLVDEVIECYATMHTDITEKIQSINDEYDALQKQLDRLEQQAAANDEYPDGEEWERINDEMSNLTDTTSADWLAKMFLLKISAYHNVRHNLETQAYR